MWAGLIKCDLPRAIRIHPFAVLCRFLERYGFISTIFGCSSLGCYCSWIRNWSDAFADRRSRIWTANAAAADGGTFTGAGEEELGEKGAYKYLHRVDNTGRLVT